MQAGKEVAKRFEGGQVIFAQAQDNAQRDSFGRERARLRRRRVIFPRCTVFHKKKGASASA
jgi:hypothetical protein